MKNISSSLHTVSEVQLCATAALTTMAKRVAFIVQEPQEIQCHCDGWHAKGIVYVSTIWNKDLFHVWMTFWSVVFIYMYTHTGREHKGTLTGLA